MLETTLSVFEKQGLIERARGQHGHLTGGFNVTVALTGQRPTIGEVTPSKE
jgi:hypothetical protein